MTRITLEETWPVLHAYLSREAPDIARSFLAPIQAAELQETQQQRLQPLLPLLALLNGQVRFPLHCLYPGMILMSAPHILGELDEFQALVEEHELLGYTERDYPCQPPSTIRNNAWNTSWVPFATDFAGSFIAVDIDPGEEGQLGQVIAFGVDHETRYVLSNSLEEFFAHLLRLFQQQVISVGQGVQFQQTMIWRFPSASSFFHKPDEIYRLYYANFNTSTSFRRN